MASGRLWGRSNDTRKSGLTTGGNLPLLTTRSSGLRHSRGLLSVAKKNSPADLVAGSVAVQRLCVALGAYSCRPKKPVVSRFVPSAMVLAIRHIGSKPEMG